MKLERVLPCLFVETDSFVQECATLRELGCKHSWFYPDRPTIFQEAGRWVLRGGKTKKQAMEEYRQGQEEQWEENQRHWLAEQQRQKEEKLRAEERNKRIHESWETYYGSMDAEVREKLARAERICAT